MTEIHEGDIVRYMGKHGFKAGYFIRHDKNGNVLLRVPEHGNRQIKIKPENVLNVRAKLDESDLEI